MDLLKLIIKNKEYKQHTLKCGQSFKWYAISYYYICGKYAKPSTVTCDLMFQAFEEFKSNKKCCTKRLETSPLNKIDLMTKQFMKKMGDFDNNNNGNSDDSKNDSDSDSDNGNPNKKYIKKDKKSRGRGGGRGRGRGRRGRGHGRRGGDQSMLVILIY